MFHKKPSSASSPSSQGATLGAGPWGEHANTCLWPRHHPDSPNLLPGNDSEPLASCLGVELCFGCRHTSDSSRLIFNIGTRIPFWICSCSRIIQVTWSVPNPVNVGRRGEASKSFAQEQGEIVALPWGFCSSAALASTMTWPHGILLQGHNSVWSWGFLATATITQPPGLSVAARTLCHLHQYPTFSKSSFHESC